MDHAFVEFYEALLKRKTSVFNGFLKIRSGIDPILGKWEDKREFAIFKFLFSGVTQSLTLTGEVARQRRDGGGVVYMHDKNCIIKLQTALSTTSWSPSPTFCEA